MPKTDYKKLLEAKKAAKNELSEKSWPTDTKQQKEQPLVLIFAQDKKRELLFNLLEGCLVLPGHVIVISDCDPADFEKNPSGKIAFVNTQNGRNAKQIEEFLMAADMAVVFEEHQKNLQELMSQGIVVIGHEKSPMLSNYHPNEETGNSFTFESFNTWSVFMALTRAHETFRFPYDWMNIVRGLFKKK